MNYTITTMESADEMQRLHLDKTGNRYLVGFADLTYREYAYKYFDTLDEAEQAFLKLASCFIRSTYSAKDRAEMLRNF